MIGIDFWPKFYLPPIDVFFARPLLSALFFSSPHQSIRNATIIFINLLHYCQPPCPNVTSIFVLCLCALVGNLTVPRISVGKLLGACVGTLQGPFKAAICRNFAYASSSVSGSCDFAQKWRLLSLLWAAFFAYCLDGARFPYSSLIERDYLQFSAWALLPINITNETKILTRLGLTSVDIKTYMCARLWLRMGPPHTLGQSPTPPTPVRNPTPLQQTWFENPPYTKKFFWPPTPKLAKMNGFKENFIKNSLKFQKNV